jgi:transcriptional regulator with XRE-family HTH domain
MTYCAMNQSPSQSQVDLMKQRQRISETLKSLLVGQSLRALARELGVNHASLNDWIACKRTPDENNIKVIASKAGVSIDWLMYGKEKSFRLGEALDSISQVEDLDQLLLIQDRFTKAITMRVREITGSYSNSSKSLQN